MLSSTSPESPSLTPPSALCRNTAPHLCLSCTFPVSLQPQMGWNLWKTGLGRQWWGMEQNGQTQHYPTRAFSAIRPGTLACFGLTAGLLCHLPLSMKTSPNSYLEEGYNTIINEDMQLCLCYPLGPPTTNCRFTPFTLQQVPPLQQVIPFQPNLPEVCPNTHCFKIPPFIH